MNERKYQRNKRIFYRWYAGMQEYMMTGDPKKKVSYRELGEKYEMSIGRIRDICKRELDEYNERMRKKFQP